MERSDSVENLTKALCAARLEMNNPIKDKSGYGYKYADLGQLLEICSPILSKHGVFLCQPVSFDGDRVVIETILMHGSEFMSEKMSLPVLQGKGMNEVQCIGSAITYGRRYSLSSFLGIAQEDSDAAELRARAPAVNETLITKDQVKLINSLLEATGTDIARILNFFKINAIEELPASKYDQVVSRLNAYKGANQ